MNKLFRTAVATAAMTISSNGISQELETTEQAGGGWQFGVYYESLSIDPQAALGEWIGDSAHVLGFNAEYDLGAWNLAANMGLGGVMYDDYAEFSQTVIDDGWLGGGDISTESSSATAMNLFAEIGPNYRLGESGAVALTARIGYGGLFASERSIANCEDCYSEDIELSGGLYGVVGASVDVGASSVIGGQYRSYFGGDLESGVRVFWQYRY